MLYVSTRNRMDSYTAHRPLHEDRAPDGGLFVPFRLPQITTEQILQLADRSFAENVATVLNLFFSVKLTGWDIEFYCGRNPVKTVLLPRRIIVAEAWHNTAYSFDYVEQAICRMLCGDKNIVNVTEWTRIAIRIAVLFGAYGTTDAAKDGSILDIAVDTKDFIAPTAAWYARKMGLPVGMIICGSYQTSAVWDLLHRGDMSPSSAGSEREGLERLIYLTLGQSESTRYTDCCKKRAAFLLNEEQLTQLNDGLFAAVVSESRVPTVIGSCYRSHGYIPDQPAAISFGALQDYRSRTGESNHTLIMSLSSPLKNKDYLTHILGITAAELEQAVNTQRG